MLENLTAKICTVCKCEKQLNDFHKKSTGAGGRQARCKECANRIDREQSQADQHRKEKRKKYYDNNKEKLIQIVTKYEATVPEKKKKWRAISAERVKRDPIRLASHKRRRQEYAITIPIEKKREWTHKTEENIQKDPERLERRKLRKAEYARTHRKEISKRANEYMRRRRKLDTGFRILTSIRNRIGKVVRSAGARKSDHTRQLLGCTEQELIEHLEMQFLPEMTWENYGHGDDKWHIDHIVMCCEYDLTREDEQRQCFHYTNLRPLWQKDNMSRKFNIPRNKNTQS